MTDGSAPAREPAAPARPSPVLSDIQFDDRTSSLPAALARLAVAAAPNAEVSPAALRSALVGAALESLYALIAEERGLTGEAGPLALQSLRAALARDHDAGVKLSDRTGAWRQLRGSARACLDALPSLTGSAATALLDDAPIDDEAVRRLLDALAGDSDGVERLGAAYEGALDLELSRLAAPAALLDGRWISGRALLDRPAARRRGWLRGRGVKDSTARSIVAALARGGDEDDAFAALARHATAVAPAGSMLVRTGETRRDRGAHYTPPTLCERIVARALEPLLGRCPSSAAILAVRLCDPAMGSGAFLLAACRQLAARLVAAWHREGLGSTRAELEVRARAQIARTCLYGVDIDEAAVALARVSLWLEVGDRAASIDDVAAGLRCGDALCGLSRAAIAAGSWRAGESLLAVEDPTRARIVGDLLLAAFLEHRSRSAREADRDALRCSLRRWLEADAPLPAPLQARLVAIRERARPLHWALEFPAIEARGGFDAFLGNPPFSGKNGIVAARGRAYLDWLKQLHPGAHGNADYAAHFFRRAASLLAPAGVIGFIACDTIGQGDTRATGLRPLVAGGMTIYDATRSAPWPGEANVGISIVHLARGEPAARVAPRLDERPVEAIDSRLRAGPERPDPRPLAENAGLSFQGSVILGAGFVLTPAERAALLELDPRNAARIAPYIGGDEINKSPTQAHRRFVIDFGDLSLEQASAWPQLLARVRARVKPERDRNRRPARRRRWWRFGEQAPALYRAIAPLERCLVTAIISKHLMFSFQPTDRVFSHKLFVFPLAASAYLALLQSRVHAIWARALSSTRGIALNYSASDCFETFPLPRGGLARLEALGAELDAARGAWMRGRGRGLTCVYNDLSDPSCDDPAIAELRTLHRAIDRAVLDAYGWSTIEAPPYGAPRSTAEQLAQAAFAEQVYARLLAENLARADVPPEPRAPAPTDVLARADAAGVDSTPRCPQGHET